MPNHDTINGTQHVVDRVKSNAKLITNNEEIAVSTSAVNAAIIALLGFDFKVGKTFSINGKAKN